jgi:hypothetical protein
MFSLYYGMLRTEGWDYPDPSLFISNSKPRYRSGRKKFKPRIHRAKH